jgi:hypothetical protein
VSLMVADFVSADYGWLRSLNGKEEGCVLFKAGKAQDGYFTNEDILRQASTAMDILKMNYLSENHVLVFDNATTHLKWADNTLSALKMPKNTPKDRKNQGVDVAVVGDDGKAVYGANGKIRKQKVRMGDAVFANSTPQSLYCAEDHETLPGVFKGMAVILEE